MIAISNKGTPLPYGAGDTSFQTAGRVEGIRKLVDSFYNYMENLTEASTIREMHPKDLDTSRDKLTRFLCGWLGGPRLYQEKYGVIRIPAAHQHLPIGVNERDAWLMCMEKAISDQPYPDDFKVYLLEQLSIPAERVRNRS